MRVFFYFDPACPYSWLASRWLLSIEKIKALEIEWKPFSLALKNHVLDKEEMSDQDYEALSSQRLLRVMLAAQKLEKADLGALYTLAGKRYHENGTPYDDRAAEIMLRAAKLPVTLSEMAEQTAYDEIIQESMNDAMGIVGKSIGTPVIAVKYENSPEMIRGFFGPVLLTPPNEEESLVLWDAFVMLLPLDVYEISRSYHSLLPQSS